MENAEWLLALKSEGPERNSALETLRVYLLRALHAGLPSSTRSHGQNRESLIEDSVQEALLRILKSIDSFRQQSKFTTWAAKIAIRIALTELRRKRWKNVSLDGLMETAGDSMMMIDTVSRSSIPEISAEQREMMALVNRLIAKELTEKQRAALFAVGMQGIPLDEVAARMDTNRNALYKLLHDARKRLKHKLEEKGVTIEEVMSSFEKSTGIPPE